MMGPPRSPYARMIEPLAPGYDPRHVEAFMRLEHPTLDHLSRVEFAREVRVAVACVDECLPGQAEAIALSYGL